jgi:hypothetical protein
MKSVKKFTSFSDLKSSEKVVSDYKSRLKKHDDFEKVIKEIYYAKTQALENNKQS